jgi:hypothetical protein
VSQRKSGRCKIRKISYPCREPNSGGTGHSPSPYRLSYEIACVNILIFDNGNKVCFSDDGTPQEATCVIPVIQIHTPKYSYQWQGRDVAPVKCTGFGFLLSFQPETSAYL